MAKTKQKVAIIHFQPVEYYPPTHNLIQYLEKNHSNLEIYFFSTSNDKNIEENKYFIKKDYRITKISKTTNRLIRLLKYMYFNIFTIVNILWTRPEKILYFESISSFPAYIVSKFFFKTVSILIHYHEYTTPSQYKTSMQMTRYFHKNEYFLYKKATWISHTNSDRIKLFKKNHSEVKFNCTIQSLPNYPPSTWKKSQISSANNKPAALKLVYVGSLSQEHMYLSEICNWVKNQNGLITFDIYSINLKPDVLALLETINSKYIKFKGGVRYDEIPKYLRNYDVGLVLYNGVSLNYVYNAPNKLFEYLACDLDVWFSKDLISSFPYIRHDVYPKVVKVDFSQLNSFDWKKAIDRKGINYQSSPFFCETVLPKLAKKLQGAS